MMLSNKRRVLEVVYGFGYGGIRAFILNYLTYIDKSKFDVDIYAFGTDSSPFTEQVEQLGFHIYFEPQNISNGKILSFIRKLVIFINEKGGYDVVHANCNLISAWVLLAARVAKVPIRLSHSHSTSHFYGTLFQRFYSVVRWSLIKWLATTKLACGKLAGETMYGRNASFVIIPNGINVEKFMDRDVCRMGELRTLLRIPANAKVYANVTRMDTNKNHQFALRVFAEILKLEPNSIFVYGGVTPTIQSSMEEVEKTVKDLGIKDSVRYIGAVKDIENLYHTTDLWIYCSKNEGLPFGPLELQAASVPVMASDVITREIDLGLGIVSFHSLYDEPRKWALYAVSINKKQLPKDLIMEAFKRRGFDIKNNIKLLERIYSGEFV